MTSAPTRRRLPNRRAHLVLDFEHGGLSYTAGVGFFDDDGRQPAEIFLTTNKHGSLVDTNAARCSHRRLTTAAARLPDRHAAPRFDEEQ